MADEFELENLDLENLELDNETDDCPANEDSIKQYMADISSVKEKTADEIDELLKAYKNGDKSAKGKIVEGCLKLPVYFAKKYATSKDLFLDYVSVGNLAIMRAVDFYDNSKGNKFITYACDAIKNAMYEFTITNVSVKLPKGDFLKKYLKLKSAKYTFEEENNRTPSIEELVKASGIKKDIVMSLIPFLDGVLSLDYITENEDEDSDNSLLGAIEQDTFPNPEKQAELFDLRNQIEKALNRLKENEKLAIVSFFGLFDTTPMTYQEMADTYGATRQRWQQLQKSGMEKLKTISKDYGLQMFLQA